MRKDKKHTRNAKGLLTALAAFTLALGAGVAVLPQELVKVSGAVTSTATITKANKTAYSSGFADDYQFQIGTGNENIAMVNNGNGTITVKYNKNSAGTHSVFNNGAGEFRLYPGGGNGGGLTFTIGEDYTFTKVTITTTKNPSNSLVIDGTAATTKTFTEEKSEFAIKNSNSNTTGSDNQVRLTSIEINYTEKSGAPVPDPTSITITAAGGATSVKINRKLQLSATVNPTGTAQDVTWSSNNNSIATVDSSGLVKGVGAGTVVITAASVTKPTIKGTITLTVPQAVIYDGGETFEKHDVGGSYANGQYEGDDVLIIYNDAMNQGSYKITNKGLIFRNTSGYIQFTLTNGLSTLKFDWMKAFTSAGNRQLGIYINGVKVDETEALDEDGVIQTYENEFSTPYSGITIVKIANLQGKQVVIDNVEWNDGPELTFGVLDSLEINTSGVQTVYYDGDELSLTGIIAIAYDKNGKDKIVSSEITSNPAEGYIFKISDVPIKSITISFTEGGVTVYDSFDVTVIELIYPTHFISNVASVHTAGGDSSASIALETSIKDIFVGELKSLLVDGVVKSDSEDEQTKIYYGGTNNTINEIQPLKFGSTTGKGKVKFTFTEEIQISKITIFARRTATGGATNATLQVNGTLVQNIGVSGQAGAKFEPYVFEGAFGNEIVVRNNTNVPVYVYGFDLEYTTYEEDALAFANEVISGVGLGAEGNCHAVLEELEEMYDGLSSWAQEEFETNPAKIFVNARARLSYLRAWTSVNTKPDPHSQRTQNQTNTIVAALVIGAIGVATLGGYFFLNKRKVKLIK